MKTQGTNIAASNTVLSYVVASATVVAITAILAAPVIADANQPMAKSQDRHPDIAALATAAGERTDAVYTKLPKGARDVVIVLPDGRTLTQRYYASGYSVIVKTQAAEKNIAGARSADLLEGIQQVNLVQ